MCFSANASFGSAAVLFTVGVISLKKVKEPSTVLLATIPILFALQQYTEGVVWLSLTRSAYKDWGLFATRAYLFFAQVIWPVWIPLSLLKAEKDLTRKKILQLPLLTGILVAVYLFICLLLFRVKAEATPDHIRYYQYYPTPFRDISGIVYFFSAVAVFFISKEKKQHVLGLLILVSLLVAQLRYPDSVVSVWCFFAAIISVYILYMINATAGINKTELSIT